MTQAKLAPKDQPLQPAPVMVVKEPLKVLLMWSSPIRPFKKRDREFYTTAGSIIFLICVILLFIKEFLLIMVLIALAFLVYILSSVKPEEVEHQITTRGIRTGGKLYLWEQLGRFWFVRQWQEMMLMVEHFGGLPTRLLLLIDEQQKQLVQQLLDSHLLHEKPEKTQVERAGEWLQKKVPLETARASNTPSPVAASKK